MTVILFQRGATSWGFQFGNFYFYLNFMQFWGRGGTMWGTNFGSWGWQAERDE